MPLVQLEHDGFIATITLNHDEKRNALSTALIDQLIGCLDTARAAGSRCVILRANKGVKVWSAGHDVGELPRSRRDPLAYDDPLERGVRAIRDFPAPVIALLEGSIWGGACELVLCCDIPIATPTVSFALTPAKIGVPYNPSGILRMLSEVDSSILKEMFFTALPIPAQRALDRGLINHLVEPDRIDAFVLAMAQQIASLAPLSIAVIKEQIRVLNNAHPLDPEAFERIQGLRRKVYDSADYHEGVSAFLERRKPTWKGQ